MIQEEKMKENIKDSIMVSHAWTQDEIKKAIEKNGKITDEEGIKKVAELLESNVTTEYFLEGFVKRNACNILCPASEPKTSLYRLGVALPSCEICGCLDRDDSFCSYYNNFVDVKDSEPGDCEHHYNMEDCTAILGYDDEEFPIPFIRIDSENDYPYPDALEVVKVLQKIPRWAEELDEIRARVDDVEDPAKWNWV